MEEQSLLSDDQIERILTSFIAAKQRRGQSASEEECTAVLRWAILAIVNHTSLQLLLENELEIEEFDGDDIQFVRPESLTYHTPLMNQLLEQINSKSLGE